MTANSTGNVYFTSDLHLGNEKVAEQRGFSRIEDHDQWIMNMFHQNITSPWDIVWILGDAGVHDKFDQLKEIHCIKRLVYGDKDGCHPLHLARRAQDYRPNLYLGVFESYLPYVPMKIADTHVMLAHLPYNRDSTQDRTRAITLDRYRLRDEGQILIHGHVMDGSTTTWSEIGSPQFNVAVDSWQGLVPYADVEQFVDMQPKQSTMREMRFSG